MSALFRRIVESYYHFDEKQLRLVSFVNPYSYVMLRERMQAMHLPDVVFVDGISLAFLFSLLGFHRVRRLSFDMTSLGKTVLETASQTELPVAIVGTSEASLQKSIKELESTFPDLRIGFARNGYFSSMNELRETARQLAETKARVAIVGLGTPLQEEFLVELGKTGWNGTAFSCGGFLDQTAVKIDYYPRLINMMQLRWLFRLFKEPKKVIPRLIVVYPRALFLVIFDAIKYRFVYQKTHKSETCTKITQESFQQRLLTNIRIPT